MSDQDINESVQSNLKKITQQEFAAKFPTKRDIWRFLTNECRWFLPPEATVTIWHLKELARGERAHIKRGNERTIHIPQYEGLTIDDILTYAKRKADVMKALPAVEHETLKLPREYIGNVIATIAGEPFIEWVDERIKERNAKYKEVHDQNLELDEEVAAVYYASTSVGTAPGRGANLLKAGSKRRRPKAQIQEDQRRAQAEKEEVARKLQELEELKLERGSLQEKVQRLENDGDLVQHLFQEGVIKEGVDGNIHVVDDPNERMSLLANIELQKEKSKSKIQSPKREQPAAGNEGSALEAAFANLENQE